MKILKKIGIVLAVLIALLLVISFFLPANMNTERSMVINAPASVVFDQVNNLKNWEKWSPWLKMDPSAKLEYSGPESGTGAAYTWKGDKLGEGKMTITDSKPAEMVNTRLEMAGMDAATSGFTFTPEGNGTKVTWSFESPNTSNPMHRWMHVIMKGMMTTQFDNGLTDIKKIAESMPPPPVKQETKVEATTVNDMNYLAVRDTATLTNISQKIGTGFGIIGAVMKKQNLKMSAPPFVIYYTHPPADFIMDVAAATDKPGKASGNVKPGMIKAGNAVVGHYFGNYMNLAEGYDAVAKWIAANSKTITGNPWEVYITDPGMEKDTAKWQTDIYFPVK